VTWVIFHCFFQEARAALFAATVHFLESDADARAARKQYTQLKIVEEGIVR